MVLIAEPLLDEAGQLLTETMAVSVAVDCEQTDTRESVEQGGG
ncbi:hypothetical protein [Streptomyces chartreusis]